MEEKDKFKIVYFEYLSATIKLKLEWRCFSCQRKIKKTKTIIKIITETIKTITITKIKTIKTVDS